MSASERGRQRERDVRRYLESPEGGEWWVSKAGGSFGDADLVAGKAGSNPRLIEVKSTAAGPFHSFGPKDRAELLAAAKKTGFTPELAWYPPYGKLEFITPDRWP